NYDTALNGDFECCSLTINNTFTLDIKDTDYVVIQNDLTVNGTLEVQNQGSLVMISDTGVVTNNGTTNVRKMSTLFDLYDYTFWSSPIVSAPISVFSQWQTNYIFKLSTANFRDDNVDSHDDNQDAWVFTPQAEIMSPGRGYAAMGKIAQTFPAQQASVYSGAVNNGVITQPIALSLDNTKANDDFNLVGNPYPSAISADAFITANLDISGTLYFWTHEGDIQVAAINPGPQAYNFSPADFAYYNLVGGTRAGQLSGNGNSNIPNGFIASGQGFQVDANAATSVTFNNSMRGIMYTNTNFYRTTSGQVEKDRLWLNLTNSEGIFSQQLIGFFPNATMGIDRGYDGYYTQTPTYAAFYSMIEDKPYKIQGRSSFDVNDRVPLGFRSAYEKTYSISIDDIQGVLRDQNVYIEDLQLNVIHDLKASNYIFSTPAGEFNNRFVLRFTNTTLGTTDFDTVGNSVVVYTNDGINITSSSEKIKEVTVYDMLGRLIGEVKNGDSTSLKINNVKPAQAALIVKVVLENGSTVSKKVIY
ncbi:MAG TPA: T9SS sorting signal type C domain-containing protein, partial [Flavobacterium sp.]|uniref:T9SS sorting signal type C domain-containing protein n=1 Tax=Flavobacterium sp. TaxID=239 RepID=UPI002C206DC8